MPFSAGDVRIAGEGDASGEFKIERKDLKVVAIMPCTAKKFEAQRPEMGVMAIRMLIMF